MSLWSPCYSSMPYPLLDLCVPSSQEEAHQGERVLLGPMVPLGLPALLTYKGLVSTLVSPMSSLWWFCCSNMADPLLDLCVPSSQEEAHQGQRVLLGPMVPLGLPALLAYKGLVSTLVSPMSSLWWFCCSNMADPLLDLCVPSSQEEAHQGQRALLGPMAPLGLLWLVSPMSSLWWFCCSSMPDPLLDLCVPSSQEEANQGQRVLLGPMVPLGLLWLVSPMSSLWWFCCSNMADPLLDLCVPSSQEEAHQGQRVLLGPMVPLGLLWLVSPMSSLWWFCCSNMADPLLDLCVPSSQEEAHQGQRVLLGPMVPLGLPALLAYKGLVSTLVCPMSSLWLFCCSNMADPLLDLCVPSSQEEAHQGQRVLLGPMVPLGLPALVFPTSFLSWLCCGSKAYLLLDRCVAPSQAEARP